MQSAVYVDASVWIALLCLEEGSASVQDWMGAEKAPLVTGKWALAEVASGLSLKARRLDITPEQATQLWHRFCRLLSLHVKVVEMASADYDEAARRCNVVASGIRAGDALHLAVAMRVGANRMATLDKVLAKNAQASNMTLVTLN